MKEETLLRVGPVIELASTPRRISLRQRLRNTRAIRRMGLSWRQAWFFAPQLYWCTTRFEIARALTISAGPWPVADQ